MFAEKTQFAEKKMTDTNPLTDPAYKTWLRELKQKVRQAQLKAAVQVNTALIRFYWELGADIVEKQKNAPWGSGFLKQLSSDLMAEFPDLKGFSLNNLQYVRRWYSFYTEVDQNSGTACSTIDPSVVAQIVQSIGGAQRLWTACSEPCEATAFAKHKHFTHSGIRPRTRAWNSGEESFITHHSSFAVGISFAEGVVIGKYLEGLGYGS